MVGETVHEFLEAVKIYGHILWLMINSNQNENKIILYVQVCTRFIPDDTSGSSTCYCSNVSSQLEHVSYSFSDQCV